MSLSRNPTEDPRWFVMQSLFQARDDLGFDDADGDGDVNVYIADLLVGRISGHSRTELYDYDYEVAEQLQGRDEAGAFYLLKRHADYILVSLGIFHVLPRRGGRYLTRDHYLGWGKSYYDRAASFRRQIDRSATARVDVLRKLASGFEGYVSLLDHMRAEYLGLRHRMGKGTMFHLGKQVATASTEARLKVAVDTLLDTYSLWLAERSEVRRTEVVEALAEVRDLDPTFTWPADALD